MDSYEAKCIVDEISISVCICTMSRPDDLRKALIALNACDPRPSQVLVSDDSPAGDRRTEELCTEFTFATYQVGPRKGLSANRNAAIVGVTTDWIHFIDDDVIVPDNFYATCRNRISETKTTNGLQIFTGWEQNYKNPAQALRVKPHNVDFWGYQILARDDSTEPLASIVINATLFPLALFRYLRFDEALRFGCEEVDVARHAVSIGSTLTFCDDLYVKHYPSPSNRELYRPWSITSKVYATSKGHLLYSDRPLLVRIATMLAYLTSGPIKLVLHNIRKNGLSRPGIYPVIRGLCCIPYMSHSRQGLVN